MVGQSQAQPVALPHAQQLVGLWTRAGEHAYAVIDSGVVPGLAQRLAASAKVNYDLVSPPAPDARTARKPAYLVQLTAGSPLASWLFTQAVTDHPDWGAAVLCSLPMLPVRQHLRRLGQAQRPDGTLVPLRWWEPEVAAALLPTLTPQQLDSFFGPLDAVVLPRAAAWTWFQSSAGPLLTDLRPVAS